jgi:hypothetical protein
VIAKCWAADLVNDNKNENPFGGSWLDKIWMFNAFCRFCKTLLTFKSVEIQLLWIAKLWKF